MSIQGDLADERNAEYATKVRLKMKDIYNNVNLDNHEDCIQGLHRLWTEMNNIQ